jgi:hypothetical protein
MTGRHPAFEGGAAERMVAQRITAADTPELLHREVEAGGFRIMTEFNRAYAGTPPT